MFKKFENVSAIYYNIILYNNNIILCDVFYIAYYWESTHIPPPPVNTAEETLVTPVSNPELINHPSTNHTYTTSRHTHTFHYTVLSAIQKHTTHYACTTAHTSHTSTPLCHLWICGLIPLKCHTCWSPGRAPWVVSSLHDAGRNWVDNNNNFTIHLQYELFVYRTQFYLTPSSNTYSCTEMHYIS